MKTDTHETIFLKDYAPPPYRIDTVHLDVSLHPTATRVRSKLKLRRNAGAPEGKLELDGEALELVGVKLDGRALTLRDYHVSRHGLLIHRVPTKPFTLEIETLCDPTANTTLSGLYRSRGVYTTQCEAQGFRRITYFLDRPDVMSVYTTRIEADIADAGTLLGNGNPTERGTLAGGSRHYAVWHDPHPKPSYLFALVGGNLASMASSFRTAEGRDVDLRIYVEPGKQDRCGWAMDALKRSMRWDEERFGRCYDLDVFNIVAVSDFNMGAMENKGLNIFNDRLILASPATATDQSYADIERIIAHEYFHNWTGNRITCRDWFQLCLKEGLTVYRDQEFSADTRSRAVQRIIDVRNLKTRQFAEDAGPLAHPVRPDRYIEINNFYTSTVYEKGAELVRMIATLIGERAFCAGMDLYFERHDNTAATVEDFIACFAAASGADLDDFMTWYRQAGTPVVRATFAHDPATRRATLKLAQATPPTPGQPTKAPVPIPIRLGLVSATGRDVPARRLGDAVNAEGVLVLRQPEATIHFDGLKQRPIPSLLRGFSAPVTLHLDLSDADLAFLMARDSDTFSRWQAAQTYATRLLAADVAARVAGTKRTKPAGYIAALAACLDNTKLDPALRALLATPPGFGEITRHLATDIDPDAIHAAQTAFAKAIGTALGEPLTALYHAMEVKGRYSPLAKPAGRRALRNRALALLFTRGRREDVALARAHFDRATNATDETMALALLTSTRSTARREALARFHQRWRDDHIMINHWFIAQATAPLDDTLAVVTELLAHPAFSLTNPNKVQALIGAFSNANPVAFHRPDGSGYDFLANQVRALDRINPQMAARLVGAFKTWRTLESGRRSRVKSTLTSLAATRNLSRDVYEIVSRMLE
jgi:aminopeptidase N